MTILQAPYFTALPILEAGALADSPPRLGMMRLKESPPVPSFVRRKHGEDDGGKTEDDGGGGGGGTNGAGGQGPGSQTTSPTRAAPQTTTVTAISTSTRVTISISTKPAVQNNGSSANGPSPSPSPTPEPPQAPTSPTQTGAQAAGGGVKVAPTSQANQDSTSPGTSPAPGSPSSGPPPSPSPGSSSSSVVFVINNPANTTVCDSLLLSWSYVGQSPISLTLAVQEQNSPFANNTASALSSAPSSALPPRILSTNISSSAADYQWSPVDVKEGWYNARAYDTANTTGISASSSPFFVAQGLDTSCLLALGPTQSSTPTASGSPGPNDATSIPVGDIVGIALGVTAGILGLITAFVLPRMRKRDSDSKPLLDSPKTITKKQRPRLLY
ncbi:hypothetical protein D9619_005828 [Psilocybe cf. subviscida]|uniref:Uncharacterized protein n=1 Tax=Psilocybe cf. subviscida TaxID=2480587 RepID=A0A8H5BWV7_9AGAR|nr:hypothetical protein D9619_005828 [Psilocybe cf. subviscida]